MRIIALARKVLTWSILHFFPYTLRQNCLSWVWEFIQPTTKNMELITKYTERIRWCQIFLRHKLKISNLKTVHLGYVKRIYLILGSYSFFLSFLSILFNLIILCYIIIHSSYLTLIGHTYLISCTAIQFSCTFKSWVFIYCQR